MLKKFLIILGLLLCPVAALAQNTTVTATVTDANSTPYAFATGYAALVCPGNQAPTYNGFSVPRTFTITGFDGNGTFTQVVYDVSVLVPSGCGYQWHITAQDGVTNFITGTITSVTGASVNESTAISAYAVLLPSTGGSSVKINGSTVTNPNFNSATPSPDAGQAAATFKVSGSNVIAETSTTATAVPFSGVTAGTNASALVVGGSLKPSGAGAGIIDATCTFNMICAADYVKQDALWVTDAVFTMGSKVATSAAGLFTASDVGKTCFGTNGTTDVSWGTSTVIMPQCTIITFSSANSVITDQNATASTTTYTHGMVPTTGTFVWGTSGQDTALETAWTAAESTGKPLYLCGDTLVAKGHFNAFDASKYGLLTSTTATRRGFSVIGCGASEAFIIPLPNFDATTCTGGASGAACFLGAPNMWLRGFSIVGFGNSTIGSGFANKNLVEMTGDSYTGLNLKIEDVFLMGWGGATPNTTVGLRIGGTGSLFSGALISNSIFESFGYTQALFDDNHSASGINDVGEMNNVWFAPFANGGPSLNMLSGNWHCSNCGYGQGLVEAQSGATFVDEGGGWSFFPPNNATAAFLATGSGSSIRLIGSYADTASAATVTVRASSGGVVHISNSIIKNTGSTAVNGVYADTGTIYDDCGNTFVTTGATPYNPASTAGSLHSCGTEPSLGGRCLLASQAGPLACGIARHGKVAIPTMTTSYTINTTAVESGSDIIITPTTDNTGIPSSPTCVLPTLTADPSVSASVVSTSFTIAEDSVAGITCYSWSIR